MIECITKESTVSSLRMKNDLASTLHDAHKAASRLRTRAATEGNLADAELAAGILARIDASAADLVENAREGEIASENVRSYARKQVASV